jgi:hypothetical protein
MYPFSPQLPKIPTGTFIIRPILYAFEKKTNEIFTFLLGIIRPEDQRNTHIREKESIPDILCLSESYREN